MTDVDPAGDEPKRDLKPTSAAILAFAQAQSVEAEARKIEAQTRVEEIKSNERIALAAIKAQADSEASEHSNFNRYHWHRYVFIAVLVLIAATFGIMVFLVGGKEVGLEVVKALIYGGAGLVGGYFAGKSRGHPDKE